MNKTTPNTGQRWRRNRDGQLIDIEESFGGNNLYVREVDTGITRIADVRDFNTTKPHGYTYLGSTP